MKGFILTEHPNFGEERLTLDGFVYELKQIKQNGCYLTVYQMIDGLEVERDRLSLTKTDMKALFMLLCTERK